MSMRWKAAALVLGLMFFPANGALAQGLGFTQEDRDRLVKLEATLQVFMQQVDKRFEQVDKHFEQVDRRFDQVDKRFQEVHNRFEQLTSFLWMLVAIFTSLTAVVIGFAYWDRRTIVRKARDEAIEAIEKEGKVTDLVHALRRLAAEDPKVAEILRGFRLL